MLWWVFDTDYCTKHWSVQEYVRLLTVVAVGPRRDNYESEA